MAGRKKKLTDTLQGNRSKDELAERKQAEEELYQFKPITSDIPAWLDTAGKKEYKRILPLLEELPIADLDKSLILLYCSHYATFIKANQDIKKNGITVKHVGAYGSYMKKNPAVEIANAASKEIKSIASSLGMSIDSRMRIVTPEGKEEDDPFADLAK